MIHLQFSLTNPFNNTFKNLCNKSGKITTNKYWEMQFYRDDRILAFCFDAQTRCNHAGIKVELSLLGYTFAANIYDSRHWNYQKNTWEVYE
jgi:hypothetical protein